MVPKIGLIGATGAGKSALLAQAARACRDGGHGWPDGVEFRLFGRRPGTDDASWLPAASYELGELEEAFRAGGPPRHRLGDDHGNRALELLVERRDDGSAPTFHPLDVFDLPGDLVDRGRLREMRRLVRAPGERTGPDAGRVAAFDAALDALAGCDALIVAMACRGHADRAFADGLDDLRLLVGAVGGFAFTRLVVAWTRYHEVVPVQGGEATADAPAPAPFDLALRPDLANRTLSALREARPASAAALEALEEDLDRRLGTSGAEAGAILHVPVSASGFSPESGLIADGPHALPFLAADPLLLALFGGPAGEHHLPHRPPRIPAANVADGRPPGPEPRRHPFRRLVGMLRRSAP